MSKDAKNPIVERFIAEHKAEVSDLNGGWVTTKKGHDADKAAMRIKLARVFTRFRHSLEGQNITKKNLREFRRALIDDVTKRADELGTTPGSYTVYASHCVTILSKADYVNEVLPALGMDENAEVTGDAPDGAWNALYEKYKEQSKAPADKPSEAEVAETYFRTLDNPQRLAFLARIYGDSITDLYEALEEMVLATDAAEATGTDG